MRKEAVSILASFCVWIKSLMCKDAINRDSTCQSIFKRLCTAKKMEDFRLAVSRPDDVLSRPDAHLSTAPFVQMTCHTVWTPDRLASSVWTTYLFIQTLHCIEKLLFQLASVRTSQQPVRTSITDRSASDSFQVQDMGRMIHRPDARSLIWKLLAADVRPSRRQCLTVRTRLLNRKDFQRNFQKILSTVVRPNGSSSPFGRCPYILLQSPILYLSL